MLRFAVVALFLAVATLADVDWLERSKEEMRDRGMSEDQIASMLQEGRPGELERGFEDLKRGSEYSWEEAKGYDDCEVFRKERMEKWGEMRGKKGGSYGKGGRSWSKGKWDKKKGKSSRACMFKPKPIDEICAENECPAFDKVNGTGCGYTARILHESVWVGTYLTDYEDPTSYTEGFWRLFQYINGSNSDGAKIEMTVPVITSLWMDTASLEVEESYMLFYLPAIHQDSPPEPTNDDVFLETIPRQYVYSRAMGGNSPSKERWQRTFNDLYRALEMDGITPDIVNIATAGYTRPYFGRQRQEAMYFASIDD